MWPRQKGIVVIPRHLPISRLQECFSPVLEGLGEVRPQGKEAVVRPDGLFVPAGLAKRITEDVVGLVILRIIRYGLLELCDGPLPITQANELSPFVIGGGCVITVNRDG